MNDPVWAKRLPDGWELRLKVVPGASRSRIAGVLGDRLKVQVAAPPEAGKANAAVIDLLAGWLGCARRDLELTAGQAQPQKTVRWRGGGELPQG